MTESCKNVLLPLRYIEHTLCNNLTLLLRCVTVWQTAQTPHSHHMEAPLMSRAVGAGAPGVPGAPAAPPVAQASWAGRGPALQETRCATVGDRTFSGSNASTPPALVRRWTCTKNIYFSEQTFKCDALSSPLQWMVSGCRGWAGRTVPVVVAECRSDTEAASLLATEAETAPSSLDRPS